MNDLAPATKHRDEPFSPNDSSRGQKRTSLRKRHVPATTPKSSVNSSIKELKVNEIAAVLGYNECQAEQQWETV
jgi:hypothetical protein